MCCHRTSGTEFIIMRKLYHIFIFLFVLVAPAHVQADLTQTIKNIKPSIVGVGTIQPTRAPKSLFMGTGFVVGDGQYVVTNAHVLPEILDYEKNEKLAVFLPATGNQITGLIVKKIAVDKHHDLALLKLTNARLPALELAKDENVLEGKRYAFTGFPVGMIIGLTPVTHEGIVSAITPIVIPAQNSGKLNPTIIKRQRNPYHVYQLDATAYPGNSGSPLYDIKSGKVVAVINKVFVKESKEAVLKDPSGITYAIPVKYVKALLDQTGKAN